MRTASEMKADFGGVGSVSDGANEQCEFVEIANINTGKFVTLDMRWIAEMSEANYQSLLTLLTAHLGD